MLKNLGEYLERLLLRHHSLWREQIAGPLCLSPDIQTTKPPFLAEDIMNKTLRPEVAARHQVRAEVYKKVFELLGQCVPIEQVAESVGKSTRTIIRWSKEGECRPRTRNRNSELDQHWGFIRDWQINQENNVMQLWRELQKHGYRGSSMAVRRYLERKKLVLINKRRRIVRSKTENKLPHELNIPLITPRPAVLKLLHSDKLHLGAHIIRSYGGLP